MILALDFETGGKTAGVNQVVSLGLAIMDGPGVLVTKEWVVGPKRHYKTKQIERVYDLVALEISGITWKQIKDAPSPECVVRDLHDFAREHACKNMPVVAYNAPFDLGFYSDLLFMAGNYDQARQGFSPAWPPFVGEWHCAMLRAKDAYPNLENYKLDTAAAHFGLSRSGEKHGALEDAILAGKIFDRLQRGAN